MYEDILKKGLKVDNLKNAKFQIPGGSPQKHSRGDSPPGIAAYGIGPRLAQRCLHAHGPVCLCFSPAGTVLPGGAPAPRFT